MSDRPRELTSASARAQRKALLGEDDATLVFETSKEVSVINTFDQMHIKEVLLRGIYAYGRKSFLLHVIQISTLYLVLQGLRNHQLYSKEP